MAIGHCISLADIFFQDFEKNFYLTGTHKILGCSNPVPNSVVTAIQTSLSKETTTVHELYYNYFSNKNVGTPIDNKVKERIANNLQTLLKADDSLSK